MGILDGLKSPDDIKKLNISDLNTLCSEIRDLIIKTAKSNGGHLSANLGIIETTVALYYVFGFPKDKIIFDVGHQCYAHKILSGRYDQFSTIRMEGGLSGFPDSDESKYDSFTVGHAGDSISAGLGYAMARDRLIENYKVVSVVGDGAFSNGLNLEALAVSEKKPKNFIVILNDNGMSISQNKTGMYRVISKLSTKRSYLRGKKAIKKVFGNSFVTKILRKCREFIKRVFNRNNYFEQFGFKYVGIVDGNNLSEMINILHRVKNLSEHKAVLLHIKTTKGKGYDEAEKNSDLYHGVGKNLSITDGAFSCALAEKLNELIEKDKRIVAITAGMKIGTGLYKVEETHPNNVIDVGIAEEYATTLSAGLALGGIKPVVAIYSTFLQRAYDEILHDVCIQNLPVVFCLDRAGVVGNDGKTHQGVFDLSYLSHIPNMTVLVPSTLNELKEMLEYALMLKSPVAIRYPADREVTDRKSSSIFDSLWDSVSIGEKVTLLPIGNRMADIAFKVREELGDGVGIVVARSVKPLDEKVLDSIKDKLIVTIEDNAIIGGFGSMVSGYYKARGENVDIISFGIKDEFVKHGQISSQLNCSGISVENIVGEIKLRLKNKVN